MSLKKIISGGQTGIDRMGLEVAKSLGYETGGTACKNFMTENGPDYTLRDFGLIESDSDEYPYRTFENVKNSQGTVLYGNESSRGSLLAKKLCKNHRPIIINPSPGELRNFIDMHSIEVLNVAGNRMSKLTSKLYEYYKEGFRLSIIPPTS